MSDNKNNLLGKFIGDVGAGAISGFAVAPMISAVDRALAENASGKASLGTSFVNSFKEMAANPVKFLRSPQFLWCWLVYGATYTAANTCQTYCDATETDVKIPKLMSTFTVNTTTCILKDRAFAKIFSDGAPKGAIPAGSYGAWLVRDIGSMAVFFTLPPIVGREIAEMTGSAKSGEYVAQFGLPLIFQTVFTPLHLLGYDIYNNPNNNVGQRITFLKKDYWKNVGMRCVRQAPPWSIGTIGNKELRNTFHSKV